jgi:DNA-binding NarL/FixJ family response regulator
MIRVLLVDDQPLLRSGFRALLEVEDDIEVVAEAADGSEGLALAREHLPDIALIDIQMPAVDGIEATRRIAADPTLAGVHVVILTNYGLDEYVFNAQPLTTGTATGLEELTNREREAVVLVAQGLSNDQIADRMVISPMTAKTHINRAMAKLHARNSSSSPTNPAWSPRPTPDIHGPGAGLPADGPPDSCQPLSLVASRLSGCAGWMTVFPVYRFLRCRLEQLDGVAGGVVQQDLLATEPGHDVVAEVCACLA